jgi:hypothetical protein
MYAHANNDISCVYISVTLGVAALIAHAIASRLTRGVYESLVSVPYNSVDSIIGYTLKYMYMHDIYIYIYVCVCAYMFFCH